jgi:hypothetical protein
VAGLTDAGERAGDAAVADSQEVRVSGVVTEGLEEDLAVEGGAVVVDLTLDPLELAGVTRTDESLEASVIGRT